jgi:hypothetical protein
MFNVVTDHIWNPTTTHPIFPSAHNPQKARLSSESDSFPKYRLSSSVYKHRTNCLQETEYL